MPGVTDMFGLGVQNEPGQSLTEFCHENALVIANTILEQHNRWLYKWASPDGQYQIWIDYILTAQSEEVLYSQKIRPGADCSSGHQILIAKFRLKLNKVGKTTRPFRYDLNHLLWLCSGGNEEIQRIRSCKGLVLHRVSEELWTVVCNVVQEGVAKIIPKKRNARRQISCLGKAFKYLRKGEKWKSK